MKNLIASTIVLVAMSAFANETAPAHKAAAPAQTEVKAEVKKMDKKTATKECKSQKLKGKELAECIKTKTM